MKSLHPAIWIYPGFVSGYFQYISRVLNSGETLEKNWGIHLIVFMGFLALAILLDLLLREVRNQRRSPRSLYRQPSPSEESAFQVPEAYEYLVRLVSGDRDTAFRLVKLVCENHPDKSVEWCCQKAVDDLLRDRERG